MGTTFSEKLTKENWAHFKVRSRLATLGNIKKPQLTKEETIQDATLSSNILFSLRDAAFL